MSYLYIHIASNILVLNAFYNQTKADNTACIEPHRSNQLSPLVTVYAPIELVNMQGSLMLIVVQNGSQWYSKG